MSLYFQWSTSRCISYICLQIIFGMESFMMSAYGQFDFNQVKSAVENVVDFVQQASDNVNCEFYCPTGHNMLPNKNHKPVSNGCGSLGVDIDLSHLPSLINCCDRHDVCYSTCGRKRDDCDSKFYQCLNDACDQAKTRKKMSSQVLVSIDACKITVEMIYQGVSILGCKSYMDAQKEACICLPQKNHFEL